MAQISNGESGLSARNKLNEVIDKIEGNSAIGNDIDVTGTVTMDGGSTSADFTFGDNDKAIFGAGSDLQIYHDGSNSIIEDVGDGYLDIKTNGQYILLRNTDGNNLAYFETGGGSHLYWNGVSGLGRKLQTTSTGIDVTGTVTADGLNVDGNSEFNGLFEINNTSVRVDLMETDATDLNGRIQNTGGTLRLNTLVDDKLSQKIRLSVDHATGDISFYEDTGTTPKMVWKSADERLGIGTSSPATTLDVAGTTTTDGLNLDAIAATISDTAVDIFVYDTRKDSDGGAWRKRTQHTSWYNETLNTATRGSRKEFPAVAVIVAETNKVTIYDGDDPSLPMWMVFNISSWETHAMGGGTNGGKAVTAVNGIICLANNVFGLTTNNFITETSRFQELGHNRYRLGGLANRNGNMVLQPNLGSDGYLVQDDCNDVAMTVLPNAPIDSATGLPVPTIAVATNGGVSVITDSGAVYDSSYTSAHSSVNIYEDRLSFGYTSFDNVRFVNISEITADGWTGTDYSDTTTPAVFGSNAKVTASNAISNAAGLNFLAEDTTTPANGMVAYTTSSYNTGWMNGDIKLATLSDTDDTNVTGSELVTNGTFDSDTSGWTDWDNITNPSAASQSGGKGILDGSVATPSDAKQDISVVAGKTYVVSLTMQNNSGGSGRLYMSDGANFTYAFGSIFATPTETTFSKTITPTQSTVRLYAYNTGSGSATFDNISVRLAEEDRSVNGNGLQVFGTVTKSAVASGADLVGYGGFSTSNYLEQPYNSDLDFGTGDFCIMGWVKSTSTANQAIVDTRNATAIAGFSIEILPSTGYLRLRTKASDATESLTSSTKNIVSSTWRHFACVVSSSGTNHRIYIDGELDVSASVAAKNVSAATPLWLGIAGGYLAIPATYTSLALFRISATAPSPEAIKRIYEDEKVLFQENAKAVLYGTSDAVTALAFDDTTNLLHVGTSAGRSVFQGLRRVDNTTDAITAAISASNGLVAEE